MLKSIHDRQSKIMRLLIKLEDRVNAGGRPNHQASMLVKISTREEFDTMNSLLASEEKKSEMASFCKPFSSRDFDEIVFIEKE